MAIFRKVFNKEKDKNIFKYIFISLVFFAIGVLINLVIGKIISICGISDSGAADKEIFWGTMSFTDSIKQIMYYIKEATVANINYFPVFMFVITAVAGFIVSSISSYKKQSVSIILSYLGMFIVNFSFVFIQLSGVLYRASRIMGIICCNCNCCFI